MNIEQLETEMQGSAAAGRRNLICEYYPLLQEVLARLEREASEQHTGVFSPPFAMPALDRGMEELFSVATAGWQPLGHYRGTELVLLDLMQNPGTYTTKTLASLIIVARAIEYIRRTGEKIAIIAPTSGNKGVALRDAVERALRVGLVTPDQLRVLVIAPEAARRKLRNGALATTDEWRRRNPLLIYGGQNASDVKEIARSFVSTYGADLKRKHNVNAWFSLDLRNYQAADATRAFIECDIDPLAADGSVRRIHAHAVSSAYGLLGYELGLQVLRANRKVHNETTPGFFLVQHLATPDMVLSLYNDSFSREKLPKYTRNPLTGMYEQRTNAHFPYRTFSQVEVVDPTFYTREPVTSDRMNALIRRHGGGGMVVSLWECLERYSQVRMLLERGGIEMPSDPRTILEWSLIMALVGVMNAIDRGVMPSAAKVVVHGTGLYTTRNTPPIDERAIRTVCTPQDIARALDFDLVHPAEAS